jgi:hypothetical protein
MTDEAITSLARRVVDDMMTRTIAIRSHVACGWRIRKISAISCSN